MTTRRGLAALLVAALATAAAGADEDRSDGADAAMMASGYFPVPVRLDERRRFITDGTVCGRPVEFLIDSGWGASTVDAGIGAGLPTLASLRGVLASGFQTNLPPDQVHIAANAEIGPCRFVNVPFLSEPVVKELDPGRRRIQAVLGFDFLVQNHCVLRIMPPRIYFRSQATSETERSAMNARLGGLGFVHVPIHPPRYAIAGSGAGQSGGSKVWLAATLGVGGEPVELLLDTGAQLSLIDSSQTERLRLSPHPVLADPRHLASTREVYAAGVGGRRREFRVSRPLRLEFPGFTNRAEPYGVADLDPWRKSAGGTIVFQIDGLLGADRLLKAGALLDFGARELYWYTWPKRAND